VLAEALDSQAGNSGVGHSRISTPSAAETGRPLLAAKAERWSSAVSALASGEDWLALARTAV